MKTLHIIVANKIATYSNRGGDIVCGNSDYQIEFNFDTEWEAYSEKTARFIWNGKYVDVTFLGTVCPVPIIANTDRLEVGVYAENLSTTTSAVINCKRSIRCNSNVECEGTVVVPEGAPILIEKTITENGEHYPGEDADGFYKVTVKVAAKQEIPEGYIKPIGTKTITENGTHNVTEFASVEVVVESEGEVIPNFDTVNDFKVFANSEEEGEITVDYSVSQKVALPSATHNRIAVIEEPNLIKSNIKKDAVIFGIKGEYEGSGGEDIPEISEVDDFTIFAGGADEGSLEIGYSVSQKVALPAANPALLTTIDDENFIPENIKAGVNIFGLEGAYEAEGEELPDFTEAEDFTVYAEGQEGEVEISYDVSEKVALPSGHNRLASVSDDNFIASNIKKGVSVFGLTGAFEGTNSPLPIEIATEAEMNALLETAEAGSVYMYVGNTGAYENGALYMVSHE